MLTIIPFFIKFEKERTPLKLDSIIPETTTLDIEAFIVKLAPKPEPRTKAHQSSLGNGKVSEITKIEGIIKVVIGIAPIIEEKIPENHKTININPIEEDVIEEIFSVKK